MPRVLIVDDEPGIVLAVRDELLFEGMEVESAADGRSGLEQALKVRPDVLLLDLALPGMNGFDICRKLRPELPDTWIILLTARGQEGDRITGFEAGADDYVVKPFSLRELVARIRVGLRRQTGGGQTRTVERIGDIEIDVRSHRVLRAGQEVSLTRKEFDLLVVLSKRRGEVVPREELCDLVWGPDVFITHRVIDTHIASLRKKLEADPESPEHILSVRGVGYKLE
jgi:two-component system, OmpR family, alkaline phosphatase synthesis response regulator PhoP